MYHDSSELIFLTLAWVHIELIKGQVFRESHLGTDLVGSVIESLQLKYHAVRSLVNSVLFFCIHFGLAFFASVSISIFEEFRFEEFFESLIQRPSLVNILVR